MASPIQQQEKSKADNGKLPARKRKSAPENESKAEKFVRLANKRMVKFLKTAVAVANLSNRNVYESTDSQRGKIINAVNAAAKNIAEKFAEKPISAAEEKFF